jgi:hypothetical protein
MDSVQAYAGMIGALFCVGTYAAVSAGKMSAERPAFFAANGVGSLLILTGAAHQFDIGDVGSVGQEFIWALISLFGAARAWSLSRGETYAPAPSFF